MSIENSNNNNSISPEKPEEAPTKKAELSEAEKHSSEIAKEKLAELLNPERKSFGVRFVNIEEYEEMVSKKDFSGREVTLVKDRFSNWLSSSGYEGWMRTIDNMADWYHGAINISTYERLIKLLRKAHEETLKDEERTENIRRADVLKRFRDKLLNHKSSQLEAIDEVRHIKEPSKYERVLSELKLKLENVEKEYRHNNPNYVFLVEESKKNIQMEIDATEKYLDASTIIHEFKSNDQFLIENQENLRRLIRAISYLPINFRIIFDYPKVGSFDIETNKQTRQYNLALIFDLPALSTVTSFGRDYWRHLKTNEEDATYEPANDFLGIIVLTPDKEMVGRVEETATKAEQWSHAVFDSRGNIKYPK